MGIRTTFSGNAVAVDLGSMADEMFARVVADHAADRVRASNRANRDLTGVDVSYTAAVDGRVVYRGRGDILPEPPIANALIVSRRKTHSIHVDWLWDRLQLVTIGRAIAAVGEVRSAVELARMLSNPGGDLVRFLLLQYVKQRFPQLAAAASDIKTLYRGYRLARKVSGLLTGGDATADADVLAWIASELLARSPVVSGAYREAHALYADQRFLMQASEVTDETELPAAKEYFFANTIAYARKIEFGKTEAGRDFVIQVPNRIYQRVAADARTKFRGMAEIGFEMRPVGAQPKRGRQSSARMDTYPSIVVRF